jgi:hypothetical protein
LAGARGHGAGFHPPGLWFLGRNYEQYLWGDFAGVPAIFPGLVLVLLAGFVRARRSSVVCSDAYRKALAETSHVDV